MTHLAIERDCLDRLTPSVLGRRGVFGRVDEGQNCGESRRTAGLEHMLRTLGAACYTYDLIAAGIIWLLLASLPVCLGSWWKHLSIRVMLAGAIGRQSTLLISIRKDLETC